MQQQLDFFMEDCNPKYSIVIAPSNDVAAAMVSVDIGDEATVLAVSNDGQQFVFLKRYINSRNLATFWKFVSRSLQDLCNEPCSPMATCLSDVLDVANWPSESDYLLHANFLAKRVQKNRSQSSVTEAARLFLKQFLEAELMRLLEARNNLPLGLIQSLACKAAAQSAVGYIKVALETEAIATLELAAADDAFFARVFCERGSVQKYLLSNHSISKLMHRCSLTIGRRSCGLSECRGQKVVLAAMRRIQRLLPPEKWPKDENAWRNAISTSAQLDELRVAQRLSDDMFLFLYPGDDHEMSIYYLGLVRRRAEAVAHAANSFGIATDCCAMELVLEDLARSNFRHIDESLADDDEVGETLELVTGKEGLELAIYCQELFPSPKVPAAFSHDAYVVQGFQTLSQVTEFGQASGNCLLNASKVMYYLGGGVALYAIRQTDDQTPAATVALGVDQTVQVWETSSIDPHILALSNDLAKAFTEDCTALAEFTAYAHRCTKFAEKAGAYKNQVFREESKRFAP